MREVVRCFVTWPRYWHVLPLLFYFIIFFASVNSCILVLYWLACLLAVKLCVKNSSQLSLPSSLFLGHWKQVFQDGDHSSGVRGLGVESANGEVRVFLRHVRLRRFPRTERIRFRVFAFLGGGQFFARSHVVQSEDCGRTVWQVRHDEGAWSVASTAED